MRSLYTRCELALRNVLDGSIQTEHQGMPLNRWLLHVSPEGPAQRVHVERNQSGSPLKLLVVLDFQAACSVPVHVYESQGMGCELAFRLDSHAFFYKMDSIDPQSFDTRFILGIDPALDDLKSLPGRIHHPGFQFDGIHSKDGRQTVRRSGNLLNSLRLGHYRADPDAGGQFIHVAVVNDSAGSQNGTGYHVALQRQLGEFLVLDDLQLHQAPENKEAPEGNEAYHQGYSAGMGSIHTAGHTHLLSQAYTIPQGNPSVSGGTSGQNINERKARHEFHELPEFFESQAVSILSESDAEAARNRRLVFV